VFMQFRSFCALVILVCTAVILAGCTGTPGSSGPAGTGPTADGAGTSGQAQNNLVTSPTDALPSQNMVTVDVGEKDYLGVIPITFQGGMGQIHVKTIEATVYRADGQTRTEPIGIKKGDMVEIQGTKQTDRVVVYMTFDNGDRKKTNDVMSAYRTRQ
jgi:hypothetical protein